MVTEDTNVMLFTNTKKKSNHKWVNFCGEYFTMSRIFSAVFPLHGDTGYDTKYAFVEWFAD